MKKKALSLEKADGTEESAALTALKEYFAEFGPLLQGRDLWKALGYSSLGAFAQARRRGTVPVNIFRIETRRGVFAYTHEVFGWLLSQTDKTATRGSKEDTM